jgi:hypothetical protein
MIPEALSDAASERQQRWESLLTHIRAAAEARNQIAHANPVHREEAIVIEMDEGFKVKSVKRTESDRMERDFKRNELRKRKDFESTRSSLSSNRPQTPADLVEHCRGPILPSDGLNSS